LFFLFFPVDDVGVAVAVAVAVADEGAIFDSNLRYNRG
jgi:hypothetical protein